MKFPTSSRLDSSSQRNDDDVRSDAAPVRREIGFLGSLFRGGLRHAKSFRAAAATKTTATTAAAAAAAAAASSARVATKNTRLTFRLLQHNFRRLKLTPSTVEVSESLHHSSVMTERISRIVIPLAYLLSASYVMNDIWLEVAHAQQSGIVDNRDLFHFVLERALFHGVGTFVVPSLCLQATMRGVHVLCHTLSHNGSSHVVGGKCARWLPLMAGLAIVPLFPLVFDAPFERAAKSVADSIWPISFDAHKKLQHHHHHHGRLTHPHGAKHSS